MNEIKKLILNQKNYNQNYKNIINNKNYIKSKIKYSKYNYNDMIILDNHLIEYNFINKNKMTFIDIKYNQNYYINFFKKYYFKNQNMKLYTYYEINIKHINILKSFINQIEIYSNNKNIRNFNMILYRFISNRPEYIIEPIRIKIDDDIKKSYFTHFDKYLERYI